jgi:cytochrome c oxidase subunit I+III
MSTTHIPPALTAEEEERQLRETWRSPSGFLGWFQPVNQTVIGRRFVYTAFLFMMLAGIQAVFIRLQLAKPENNFIGPDLYNQIFTMHGITMMFLFAIPVMEGLGTFIIPLMIGTRDMAFPRLNSFGYYVYALGGLLLYVGFLFGLAPDVGWFAYPPLSGPEFSPTLRADFYATLITFIEISALVAAVELIVTIFKQRAPGMTLNRMPLFVWSILVMAVMIIFAMPAVMVGSMMLALDRSVGTHFFAPAEYGGPVMWQHLFWFFGHPEVYIIFIPALGIVSTIIATFSRRRLFGYTALVLSLIATGFIGFGLWVHHMFTVGLPQLGLSFFTAASVLIAIPSGVQIFCWIATLWMGRPIWKTPLWFVMGFFFIFVIGGLTGVMVASTPFDQQVHDTFFVVAHFHYVLIGGSVFPLLGGLYYWWPKFAGRLMSEFAGKISFWLLFIGFNVTFFPMHQLGLQGMPRRVYTYVEGMGWDGLNMLATVGAMVMTLGFAVTFGNAIWSLRRGQKASNNPWDADSLEWLTESPPAPYNFRHLPTVNSRYPLWDGLPEAKVVGIPSTRREILVTRLLDAEPDARTVLPGPSWWPFLLALTVCVAFGGFMIHPSFFLIGFVLAFLVVAAWQWPRVEERRPPWKEHEQQ